MSLESSPVIKCESVYKIFGGIDTHLSNNSIDIEAIKQSGGIIGVNNASFEVYKGETLVIMGLSGSGKSTLLRCISRLIEVTYGKIQIDGEDMLAMNDKQLVELRRNKMGMVFQSFALLPHKTVLENIAFPLQIQGMKTTDSMKRAVEMTDLVGLQGRGNSYPRQLSGGQQQRVGIARSLAVEPDIWFLDEPFSALDPLIRKEMQDEFLSLQSQLNKTILFVTHDFNEALRLADRIIIMKDGVIEQIDTPADIVLHPATDYVRKFTENVPREKVLQVRHVMQGPDTLAADETMSEVQVGESAIIAKVAEQILSETLPIQVLNAHQEIVGIVRQQAIISILFDRS